MSARGPLIVAGVAIAVLAGAYAVMHEGDRTDISRDPPPTSAPRDAASDTATDAPHVISQPRPLPPVLEVPPDAAVADAPAAIDAPGAPSGAAAFEAERRDTTWAPGMERTLQRLLARQAGGRLARVECRAQQCRLEYEGTEAELADTMAAFESATGLREVAQTVTLALERGADGTMQLHAYAAFAR